MTQATSIFATLSPTVRSKLAFLKLPPAWSCDGALAGFHSPAEVLETASAPVLPAARHPGCRPSWCSRRETVSPPRCSWQR
jgi:hypothetical protein